LSFWHGSLRAPCSARARATMASEPRRFSAECTLRPHDGLSTAAARSGPFWRKLLDVVQRLRSQFGPEFSHQLERLADRRGRMAGPLLACGDSGRSPARGRVDALEAWAAEAGRDASTCRSRPTTQGLSPSMRGEASSSRTS
jgi:hypothetical protein